MVSVQASVSTEHAPTLSVSCYSKSAVAWGGSQLQTLSTKRSHELDVQALSLQQHMPFSPTSWQKEVRQKQGEAD